MEIIKGGYNWKLHHYIIKKYGSVSAFCKDARISPQTMNRLFNRDGGVRISTLLKVGDKLNLSPDDFNSLIFD